MTVGFDVYNVRFGDNSCANLYSGCDEVSDFEFQFLALAQNAAASLIQQVFLDGPLGDFDSDPTLTNGCEANPFNRCDIWIPYALNDSGVILMEYFNFSDSSGLTDGASSEGPEDINFDTSTDPQITYAIFTPVPVPAAVWLMGSALVGLVGLSRRTKS
ncbi:MAG: hypothetical protein AAGB35_02930 [Pseudomonadota bacterium]